MSISVIFDTSSTLYFFSILLIIFSSPFSIPFSIPISFPRYSALVSSPSIIASLSCSSKGFMFIADIFNFSATILIFSGFFIYFPAHNIKHFLATLDNECEISNLSYIGDSSTIKSSLAMLIRNVGIQIKSITSNW